jgi:hypothetical protein
LCLRGYQFSYKLVRENRGEGGNEKSMYEKNPLKIEFNSNKINIRISFQIIPKLIDSFLEF